MQGGWRDAIDSYCRWLAASGASRDTLRLRRHYLGHLARQQENGPWATTLDDLVAFLARSGWAPETRKSARAAARGFYRWAHATGRMGTDPAHGLPPVRVPPGLPRPTPDDIFVGALARADDRDRLMLLLAGHAGLRRAEIAGLHTRDVLGGVLRINGKGGRVREVPMTDALRLALAGRPAGYLFPGRIDGHLSPGYVGRRLARLLGAGWSAHSVRHRFASRTYAGTRDLRTIQTLLGHSKPETTMRYTAIPDGALAAAVHFAA